MRIAGTYPFPTDPDPDAFALRVLSLGAGVQSSRHLLGILEGEFGTPGEDAPSCAVFADTGWEPRPVYAWLAVLRERAEAAGFPVHVVSAGSHVGSKAQTLVAYALQNTFSALKRN